MKPIVFPKLAVNKIAPPAFEVQPPADVSSREEAMQRKASAMHQISAQDVYEFMEKVAAEDRKKVEPAPHYTQQGDVYGNKMKMESAVKKMGPMESAVKKEVPMNPAHYYYPFN